MNENKLASFFIRQRFALILEKWVIPAFSLLLLVFMIYQGFVTYNMNEEYKSKIEERDTLANSLSLYQKNTLLSDEDKVYYGSILARQIPVKENIFGTYTFVDEFVSSSGIEITQYSDANVPLAQSPAINSLSLSISGVVPQSRLKDFLNEYKYKYTRFMIMTSMTTAFQKSDAGEDLVSFTASLSLFSIPSIEKLGDDLKSLKLISFDKAMNAKYEAIRVQLNDDNYLEKIETEDDISADYEGVESLF